MYESPIRTNHWFCGNKPYPLLYTEIQLYLFATHLLDMFFAPWYWQCLFGCAWVAAGLPAFGSGGYRRPPMTYSDTVSHSIQALTQYSDTVSHSIQTLTRSHTESLFPRWENIRFKRYLIHRGARRARDFPRTGFLDLGHRLLDCRRQEPGS